MHLACALELPDRPGDVLQDLRIGGELCAVGEESRKRQPATAGRGPEDKPDYPKGKQAEFRGRRFEREDPALLDFEGAEFVMVGARDNPEEQYGLDLEPEREELCTAGIVKDMCMVRSCHSVEPLLRGEWR